MKTLWRDLSNGLQCVIELFYPHLCPGCNDALSSTNATLCFRCHENLPVTNFSGMDGNIVEKIFWGRMRLAAATSLCYFTKESIVQHILHQLKYKGNKAVAISMGRMLGVSLVEGGRFKDIDCIVPLPLHEKKQRVRGYNQAELLAEGISAVTHWPVLNNVVIKRSLTITQTHKSRTDRWENMKEGFACTHLELLDGKHVLLVDDVITTGATLEACGTEILKGNKTQLSIATMAYAIK